MYTMGQLLKPRTPDGPWLLDLCSVARASESDNIIPQKVKCRHLNSRLIEFKRDTDHNGARSTTSAM